MYNNILNKNNVSIDGEKNINFETQFLDCEFKRTKNDLRIFIIFVSLFYLLFSIMDYFFIKDSKELLFIILLRALVFFVGLYLFFLIKQGYEYQEIKYKLLFFELLFCSTYIVITGFYNYYDYLVHCMELIMIVIGLYFIPLKWKINFEVSIVFTCFFLLIKYIKFSFDDISLLYTSIVYLFVVISLIGKLTNDNYKYRKKQFQNNCELIELTITDRLTKVYNRLKFENELVKLIDLSKEKKIIFSLIIFDIDDFKEVNDAYGHLVGDEVLVKVCHYVNEVIREGDIFARWGGEEFALLLPNSNINSAVFVAERIKSKLVNSSFPNDISVSCSFGVAEYCGQYSGDDLIKQVDNYLYKAKEGGKNQIVFSNL
ncbi:GGDEF domain-containing protein [Clostridium sp. DL1XJH146]